MDAAVSASFQVERTSPVAAPTPYESLVLPSQHLAFSAALDISMFRQAAPAPCGSVLGMCVDSGPESIAVLAKIDGTRQLAAAA